jgi:hypothetical protein
MLSWVTSLLFVPSRKPRRRNRLGLLFTSGSHRARVKLLPIDKYGKAALFCVWPGLNYESQGTPGPVRRSQTRQNMNQILSITHEQDQSVSTQTCVEPFHSHSKHCLPARAMLARCERSGEYDRIK